MNAIKLTINLMIAILCLLMLTTGCTNNQDDQTNENKNITTRSIEASPTVDTWTKVTINDEEITNKVPLIYYQNNTYVPIRFFAEKLDANVEYDQNTGTIKVVNTEDHVERVYDTLWSDDFMGLKTEIQSVSLLGDSVIVKFRLENTTDQKFTASPDQARLVTSTGEQIEFNDLNLSDNTLSGEIHKGVIKEGNVGWNLKRGQADEIEWIILEWSSRSGGTNDYDVERKNYEVELELK